MYHSKVLPFVRAHGIPFVHVESVVVDNLINVGAPFANFLTLKKFSLLYSEVKVVVIYTGQENQCCHLLWQCGSYADVCYEVKVFILVLKVYIAQTISHWCCQHFVVIHINNTPNTLIQNSTLSSSMFVLKYFGTGRVSWW